jgi:hypothetical protein
LRRANEFFFRKSADFAEIMVDVRDISVQVSFGNNRFRLLQDVFGIGNWHIGSHGCLPG